MPLLIELKTGDKIIINGAVIEGAGSNTKLLVHNKAAILREKEVMSEDAAGTPAARVYFALQCAYVFEPKRGHYLALFDGFLADYAAACPSALPIVADIRAATERGEYYKGLKAAQKLLQHEGETLRRLEQSLKTAAEGT